MTRLNVVRKNINVNSDIDGFSNKRSKTGAVGILGGPVKGKWNRVEIDGEQPFKSFQRVNEVNDRS